MYRQAKLTYWRRKKPLEGKSSKAQMTICNSDHRHRSGLEARVCDELRLRKLASDIKGYIREVPMRLELDGLNLGTYIADFVVEHFDGTTEIVEAKGIAFPLFKKKWAILEHMNRNNPMVKMTLVTR